MSSVSVSTSHHHVVVAVCHPDDEALWAGGLIHALAGTPGVEVSVICVSGKDPASKREAEFMCAQAVAGYQHGVVLGGPLRAAGKPLPNIADTLEEGLSRLGVSPGRIGLLLTHSPYGEEHMHPHHQQAFRELSAWAARSGVPFGFFSCLPMPLGKLQSHLIAMRRGGEFQVLQFARCAYTLLDWLVERPAAGPAALPAYYLQFQIDRKNKYDMLSCYASIDLPQHEAGYAMFTSCVEGIYVVDKRGLAPLCHAMEGLQIPGAPDLFARFTWCARLRRLVKRLIGHGD